MSDKWALINTIKHKRSTFMKRILAWICIILLVVINILTLLLALIGGPAFTKYFIAAIFVDVLLPVMMWVMIKTAEFFKKRGEKIREEKQPLNMNK